jgi:STE24 endopeptidase
MQFGSQAFVVFVLVVLGLKFYLNIRQAKSIKTNMDSVPHDFNKSVTLEEHQKAARYNLAKLLVSQVEELFSTILLFIFTLGGGIQLINDHLVSFISKPITYGVLIIAVYTLISSLISMPFGIYSTFGIEQKFGFNNTTIKLFILDFIKGVVLSVVIGIPLLYLVLWLMTAMGSYWWVWVWIALVLFNLLVLIVYPTFIAPIFNKFTPLEDVELKSRIDGLLLKCGFKSSGVFIMDGSKRSSHGNAYFTGIGKTKRIVFFDTLLKQLNVDEIEAVLAHELGHFKKKHIVKQMLVMFSLILIVLYALSLLIQLPSFYSSLGIITVNNANALLLFSFLVGLVGFFFAPLSSYFSRKNEFEADEFAAEYTNKEHLINGLTKLYKDNASTLTPDPLYVKFYYSHPPASVRITELERHK